MKKTVTIISSIIAFLLLALCGVVFFLSDRSAPLIKVEDMSMTYSEGDDTSPLLAGVSAYDYRDGDVTDSVLVKDVIALNNGLQAKIVYAARDKANNISEGYRIVSYIPLEDEEDTDEQVFENMNKNADAVDVTPVEVQEIENTDDSESESDDEAESDGDRQAADEAEREALEEAKRLEEEEAERKKAEEEAAKKAEEEAAKKKAAASKTNTSTKTAASKTTVKDPKITLKQSTIRIPQGQLVNPNDFIATKENVTNVTYSGNVDVTKPGTYTLVYTAAGAGGKNATASMKVVVE